MAARQWGAAGYARGRETADMTKQELIDCVQDAVDALAEFRPLVSDYSPEAQTQIAVARRHLQLAIALLELRRSEFATVSPRR